MIVHQAQRDPVLNKLLLWGAGCALAWAAATTPFARSLTAHLDPLPYRAVGAVVGAVLAGAVLPRVGSGTGTVAGALAAALAVWLVAPEVVDRPGGPLPMELEVAGGLVAEIVALAALLGTLIPHEIDRTRWVGAVLLYPVLHVALLFAAASLWGPRGRAEDVVNQAASLLVKAAPGAILALAAVPPLRWSASRDDRV
ncbi:MAG: hypothetical protein HY815_00950 [Candidatus Riflebacteria bacterium]|nr:hypothetical protein [Candidatus Riflebacteria bacterium]